MSSRWTKLAESQEIYAVQDFQKAAMRLLNEQVLYQGNSNQRKDFDLIAQYEADFTQALDMFGCRLEINRNEQYVAAIPTIPETSKITLKETLLVLVLRKLYDQHMERGTLHQGIAGVSLIELETAYKTSTNRELPMKPQSELLGLFDVMKRWGVAKAIKQLNGDETDWYIQVLPGIQSIMNENAIASLKAHAEMQYEPGELRITGSMQRDTGEGNDETA
ncbi:DUF4194 domain-containing protein [Alteromonas sp. a30]|uniref:DUF4194 domain-containing protein n=1 Tax=Alteromonas sp. a30 TaxID=2730917 RepID=UPI0022823DF5|nr:DUF4194 domain-containing protein [Alteromonas sp. a30]MCY7296234.1 DUF4194 domain-containing protein [Alteromonas sp. a30]